MVLSDIDILDPDRYVERFPHEQFDMLRCEAPVCWIDEPDGPGFWAVTKHADVIAVSRDAETFSSQARTAMMREFDDEAVAQQQLMMLNMDPPEHTKLRKIVNRGFTPRMINQLESHIRELANDIVDRIEGKDSFDFVTEVAAELPLEVIAELLGVPFEDRVKIFEWSNTMLSADDPELQPTPEAQQQAAFEILDYANTLAAPRRVEPRDDIVSCSARTGTSWDRRSRRSCGG